MTETVIPPAGTPAEHPLTPTSRVDYVAFEQTPSFLELQHRHRRFVFPVVIGALVWYFAFVATAAFAPAFMATPVFGDVNLGLILGLGQFVTTFGITMWYVSYANRRLDPAATALRDELEGLEKA